MICRKEWVDNYYAENNRISTINPISTTGKPTVLTMDILKEAKRKLLQKTFIPLTIKTEETEKDSFKVRSRISFGTKIMSNYSYVIRSLS